MMQMMMDNQHTSTRQDCPTSGCCATTNLYRSSGIADPAMERVTNGDMHAVVGPCLFVRLRKNALTRDLPFVGLQQQQAKLVNAAILQVVVQQ